MKLTCPVSGCSSFFSSYALLLTHLQGQVRRNRCGAFEGNLAFLCGCGETLRSVTQVRVHCMKHMRHRRNQVMPDTPIEPVALDVAFCDDEGGELLCVVGTNEVTDDVIEEERENMYLFTESGSNVDSDTDSDDGDVISWESATGVIAGESQVRVLVDLCHYAYDSQLTERCYKMLRGLTLFDAHEYIPRSLKHLRRQVDHHLHVSSNFPVTRVLPLQHNGVHYKVPYLSIRDILSIWFSVPAILKTVRLSNAIHLPRSFVDIEEVDAFIIQRENARSTEGYAYDCIQAGTSYLDRFRSCIPRFIDEYLRARDDSCDILFCTVGLYSDNFSKNLSSLVSETMYSVTLLEATVGEADLVGISSVVAMLASAKATKALGHNSFWKVFVDELKCFERGVRMTIGGSECLVICLTHVFLGDTPALKTMCGYSPSISSTCYVKRPCMVCDVQVEDLRLSILDASRCGETRGLQLLVNLYRCNNYVTGRPIAAWLREALKELGYVYFPEFLRLTDQPRPDLLAIDSMHAQLKGALMKHFLLLIETLTSGKGGNIVSASSYSVWTRLSKEFSRYCRENRISAFCNFSSKKQFQMRMTANSMKELSRVAAEILINLDFVRAFPVNRSSASYQTWKKHMRAFEHWCIHTRICRILDQHSIVTADLEVLDVLIPQLLSYFANDLSSEFVTINIHYYVHMVDQVRRLGPMRIVSNHSRERLIRKLKPFYRNTNNRQTEASVFNRYRISLYFQIRHAHSNSSNYEFKRNFWMADYAVVFDFFCYDKVILDSLHGLQVLTRDLYYRLRSFRSCPAGAKQAKWKVDYATLEAGDYIYLTANNTFPCPFVGNLVSLMQHEGDDDLYLAYTVPEPISAERKFAMFKSKPWCISREQSSPILYISPVSHYVVKLHKYETTDSIMMIRR